MVFFAKIIENRGRQSYFGGQCRKTTWKRAGQGQEGLIAVSETAENHRGVLIMSTYKKRSAFTLVEMLAVIAIIGILIGLLIPAVSAVREAARQTQCLNNQKNIGIGILAYGNSKGKLPAVFSRVLPTDTSANPALTNWVISIFRELDKGDLAQAWQDGANVSTTPPPVKIELLICPSSRDKEPVGALSYVVNMGSFVLDTTTSRPDYSKRLFRDRSTMEGTGYSPEPDFTLVSLKNSSQTVMFSESIHAAKWNSVPTNPGVKGGVPTGPYPYGMPALGSITNVNSSAPTDDLKYKDAYVDENLAFAWPQLDPPIGPVLGINSAIGPSFSSYHRGVVVVTFCDGHSEALDVKTLCANDPEHPIYGRP
jgi:prepilin-type N-terminal cleavage/methylation domain-containing protein